MILILLAILPSPSLVSTVPCDHIELNHYRNTRGEHVLDQLIFYTWSNQRKRFDVNEWRTAKCDSMVPVPKRDGFMLRWHDDGVMREVTTRSFRETWTHYDPEIYERGFLPQEDRKPLFEMKVKE
jgi:hypothetical protein